MNAVTLKAHAKINWSLAVTGKRPDGYHELDMLLQSVTLHDFITVGRTREPGLRLTCSLPFGKPENNLAFKAAEAFYARTQLSPACRIHLHKYIPICAGMGGGSADAAAVLTALNALYRLPLAPDALSELALTLGADVPFMLRGGLARARGVGEILDFYDCPASYSFVGLIPRRGASTGKVFTRFSDEMPRPAVDNPALLTALCRGDMKQIAAGMQNHLQPVTEEMLPQLAEFRQQLLQHGAVNSMMTGSGALVYGLFPSAQDANRAAAALRSARIARVFRFDSCPCSLASP